MTGSTQARKSDLEARPVGKPRGANMTLRISPKARVAWQFWCEQMGMTYEQSVWFLIENHPVQLKVPEGVRVKK